MQIKLPFWGISRHKTAPPTPPAPPERPPLDLSKLEHQKPMSEKGKARAEALVHESSVAQVDTLVVGTTWTDHLPSEQVAVTGLVGDIAFSSRKKAVHNAWLLTQQGETDGFVVVHTGFREYGLMLPESKVADHSPNYDRSPAYYCYFAPENDAPVKAVVGPRGIVAGKGEPLEG